MLIQAPRSALSIPFLMCLFACGGGGSSTGETAVKPTITTQPQSLSVLNSQRADFSVSATGTAPLSYQWKKDGVSISTATSSNFTLYSAYTSDAGTYSVTVSNSYGSADSSSATLTVNVPAWVVSQSVPLTVSVGQAASFSVEAGGTSPITYQWKMNDVDIPGATDSTYTITSTTTADAGIYYVVVSNAWGSGRSVGVTLTVNP